MCWGHELSESRRGATDGVPSQRGSTPLGAAHEGRKKMWREAFDRATSFCVKPDVTIEAKGITFWCSALGVEAWHIAPAPPKGYFMS